eukprot:Blabericola_migrator_1__8675@NODE_4561_length_1087_cov_160_575490_g2832_i0_p1_GENE_NODE_4561_length_1087_cov_160_575490_g2832_i0NODE_4561_length_1087_cov_160_575490_g2832_i0_p1_ORF_typecomplete_len162_score30_87_NODE_4561_length_1087_cov_160_575490_g2832_i0271756
MATFADLQEKHMLLQDRLSLLEAQQMKTKKLHFWSNKRASASLLGSPDNGYGQYLAPDMRRPPFHGKQPRVTAYMGRQEGPRGSNQMFSPIATPRQLPGDTMEVIEGAGAGDERVAQSPALSSADAGSNSMAFDVPRENNPPSRSSGKRSIFMACMSAEES